jgi:cytochrome c biogenesis protein CcmG, thiol:disulfide interchange protein DsbE
MGARSLACLLALACAREHAAASADGAAIAAPPATIDAAPLEPARALCEGPGCLPAFRLPMLVGGSIASNDLAGKVALVMFWASWCEPCSTEGPGIDAVYRRHREEGFVIVGVSRDTAEDVALRAFRDRHGITYPIARSTDDAYRAFGSPPEVPTMMLYGRDGRLRWRGTGALPAAVLEGEVVRALASSALAGEPSRTLSIVAVRRIADAGRVAALLAVRREAGPTVAVLVGDDAAGAAEGRVVNALRFDAWATTARPPGVVTPAIGDRTGRRYTIAQAAGLRIALVGRGKHVAGAVAQARADGQANLVVTFGNEAGDVDLPPEGPPVEWIELHLDAHGTPVTSERRAIEP